MQQNATIIINIFWQKEKVQKFVKTTYCCFHLHSRYVVPISVHDPVSLILALYATRTVAQMTTQIIEYVLSFELQFWYNSKEIGAKAAWLFYFTHFIKKWNVGDDSKMNSYGILLP